MILVIAVLAAFWSGSGCLKSDRKSIAPNRGTEVTECESAEEFAKIDGAIEETAQYSEERQQLAQESWLKALRNLRGMIGIADIRDAVQTLEGASIAVSDQEWSSDQEIAYRRLSSYLDETCGIRLRETDPPSQS